LNKSERDRLDVLAAVASLFSLALYYARRDYSKGSSRAQLSSFCSEVRLAPFSGHYRGECAIKWTVEYYGKVTGKGNEERETLHFEVGDVDARDDVHQTGVELDALVPRYLQRVIALLFPPPRGG